MYVNDLQRRIVSVSRGAATRAALRALWHRQQPQVPGSAEECLRVAQDPQRRLEPLRRQHGAPLPRL
ncbi:hypothetical protein HB662_11275 [Roseomonas frigidaquae]|uniref:Uncharacterized protein n=1 Tax=Falsiroseomonas frigidaquae TaxID=487318 RepID=A0ABX1EZ86_9PROT|nr:hypothetical protein [Falsiroseomonas frigidaquae]NKE45359.1 hypothetical protein [Falsiroseomonas frigidaquae]